VRGMKWRSERVRSNHLLCLGNGTESTEDQGVVERELPFGTPARLKTYKPTWS
jgi:hypothetical protein